MASSELGNDYQCGINCECPHACGYYTVTKGPKEMNIKGKSTEETTFPNLKEISARLQNLPYRDIRAFCTYLFATVPNRDVSTEDLVEGLLQTADNFNTVKK